MRSMDKGDTWKAISPDLTQGGKKGNVAYGTLTTISESPFDFGLIYIGTDDGNVQLTKNGGGSWENITADLPKDLWVTRVVASKHKKERVYATLNGYRFDDFTSYVYMSEDYGETWTTINSNIPNAPVNVIREDHVNKDILYLGTDNGAFVSFNNGEMWEAFSKNLPAVAVHDMVLQEASNDLLLGTHGRSIYKTNVEPLQKMNTGLMNEAVTLFNINKIRASSRWGNSWSKWMKPYEPSTQIKFFANTAGKKTIEIRSDKNTVLKTIVANADLGFNYVDYDLSITEKGRKKLLKENTKIDINKAKNNKYYLPKGEYLIYINGVTTSLEVE